ncbi:mesoderm induction early response protein 3a isoform X1 [Oncorhynchus clarkii lewisi]|uniref:mesoderm induction early response protein 3a isoform X1 n=1 Tax=Oncorhynchus clarkii lewisi TaxID=490388 RepID=UPI0039B861CC
MAEASFGSTSPVGSLSSEDHDFDPTAEMLVHDYDDEQTLEDEEMQEEGTSVSAEIADLEKEGNMPLEELLAMYRYEASIGTAGGSSVGGSSVELTDELPDMTLDKEEIAKDLLSGDDEETQSSADDLTPSVTSHETSDFFPRTLRSNAIYDGDKESEGEEDGVCPEDTRKEIMVGSQYQAEIPALVCYYDANEKVYENEDQLLWQPDALPEQTVKDFLHDTSALVVNGKVGPALENGLVQDNEKALYELVKCNYTVHDALERYRRSEKSSEGEMPPWSEEECRNFELALLLYEKNFHLIQKHKVNTRTVAECVAFYYMWKKSERFDFFVQQNRFGKKKYSSYPGVTDLMDRLVDEAEGLVVDGSASVCSSSSGGGRMEYSAEHQLNLLNSITASDLSALTSSVASVCNPSDVGCLESYNFPTLEGLHRGSLSHDESLGFIPNGAGDPDCINLLDAGFYHSDLGQLASCTDDYDRPPSKRLKMSLPEATVENLGLDSEPRPHPITSSKMAVSVTDFGSLVTDEANGYIGTRPCTHKTPVPTAHSPTVEVNGC